MLEPFCPAYLIGKCIGQRRERRDHYGCFVRRGSEKREERETAKSVQQELCIPFTTYNKDKVPMDVTTPLVVNHVNIGVLCLFVICLCLYLWQSCRSKIIHIRLKDWITVGILCMNAKLLQLYLVLSKMIIVYKKKFVFVKQMHSSDNNSGNHNPLNRETCFSVPP